MYTTTRSFLRKITSTMTKALSSGNGPLVTKIVRIEARVLGHHQIDDSKKSPQTFVTNQDACEDMKALEDAAMRLKTSTIPVAFPTETVYGLGADATRSAAVRGIYEAKGRPSDNPLIIHVCDLNMLRSILKENDAPLYKEPRSMNAQQTSQGRPEPTVDDPIPVIYRPLIQKFWPGPLTILVPNNPHTGLAPEVTAGLKTVGVRMPDSSLALALIKLAGVPIAAPSANASTKPSPTMAKHVYYDLQGKIEIILDGGSCDIGVESTVVDGLCSPPVILRPGGLSIDDIRSIPGWEKVQVAYKDASELGDKSAPRAPGMKYKHYSPKATVILFEKGSVPVLGDIPEEVYPANSGIVLNGTVRIKAATDNVIVVGIIRTRFWEPWAGWNISPRSPEQNSNCTAQILQINGHAPEIASAAAASQTLKLSRWSGILQTPTNRPQRLATVLDIDLGKDTSSIANGLFAALRELDERHADVIFVEGIEGEGDITAAIMNRLRKAATSIKMSA